MSTPKLDFTWTPNSVALSYTINGNTYPPSRQVDNIDRSSQPGSLDSRYSAYTTPNNTLLTFTASVVMPSGVIVTEYRWDWGDGQVGYGSTATHTYKVAPPETAVKLTITDSNRNTWGKSKILNLRFAGLIRVNVNTVLN